MITQELILAEKYGISKERATEILKTIDGKEVSQEGKEVYQQGGNMYISQLAKKHNIPLERAVELVKMQMGGEVPQEQGGGQQEQIFQMVAQAIQQGAQPEELMQQLVQMGIPQEEAQQIIQQVASQMQNQQQVAQGGTRFEDAFRSYKSLGYSGDADIAPMQSWLADKYPDDVVNYYIKSGQPANAKHVDIIKEKHKDIFSKTGIDPNKPSASYTSEEKKKLTDALGEGATKEFWLEGFKDGVYDWRLPMIGSGVKPANVTNSKLEPRVGAIPNGGGIPKEAGAEPTDIDYVEASNNNQVNKSGTKNIMANFEPYIPLFSAIQPIAKQNVDLDRLEPIKMTTEPMLAEQERQRMTDVDRIEQMGLTPQQQEALMASGLASSQMASNDAISKVESWNAQNQYQTDQYNAGAGAKEQIMNNQFDSDYQDKMMATLANLEESTRNQYRTQFLQGQADRNYVTNLNKINTLSDNFAVTPYGIEYLNNKGIPVDDETFTNEEKAKMSPQERELLKKLENFAAAKKRNR